MANRAEHAVFNGVAGATAVLIARQADDPDRAAHAWLMAAATASLPSLPDVIEPPINPIHRGVFHSWAVLGVSGYLTWRACKWRPDEPLLKGIRIAAIVVGIAYTAHLARDACSARSLPLI